MKIIPIINHPASLHLTSADWDSLNFSCVAVDALLLAFRPVMAIPKSVKTVYYDTRIQPWHTVQKNKLISPYDGSKIDVNIIKKQWADEQLLPDDVEATAEPAIDGALGIMYSDNGTNVCIQNDLLSICMEQGMELARRPASLQCTCYTCQHFTLAYLHHLHNVGVPLAIRLSILHNMHFFWRHKKNS